MEVHICRPTTDYFCAVYTTPEVYLKSIIMSVVYVVQVFFLLFLSSVHCLLCVADI